MRVPRQRRSFAAVAAGVLALFLSAGPWALAGDAKTKEPPPPDATELPAIKLGMLAPDFSYDAGAGLKKLSEARGTPTIVHFWDSWCEPCTDELPLFAKAAQDDPKIAFVTFSDEGPGVARGYLKEHQLGLPVSEDPHHVVFKMYSVHAIPATVFLRADGTVAYVAVGAMEQDELTKALAKLRP